MATITEDYCSQEVYRLLREKGFDGEIHTTFDKEGYTQASITLQMAMKWLREVHNLYIQTAVTSWPQKGYSVHIYMYNDHYNNFEEVPFVEYKESYEKACEAACIYALKNLI